VKGLLTATGSGGVETCHRENVELYLNSRYDSAASREELFRLPEIVQNLPGRSSRSASTNTLWEWKPAWLNGGTAVVRAFVHGGLLRGATRDLFLGKARMARELYVYLHALSRGVPTCEPIGLRIEKLFGPFVRAHYVSVKIEGAADLLELCKSICAGEQHVSAAKRRLLINRIACAIAAMHDAGICHADLNLKNILVKNLACEPEVFIIDFDKAQVLEDVSLRRRLGNLVRLDRSIIKWPASRQVVHRSDRLRLWRDYLQLYPQWADRWKSLARRFRTRHLAHRLSRK